MGFGTRLIRTSLLCALLCACGGSTGTTTNATAGAGGQQSGIAGMNGAGTAGQQASAGANAGANAGGQSSGQAGDAQGSSGAAGAGQGTPTQSMCLPGCFAICQAGQCQCECSALNGCNNSDWQPHTVSWQRLGQGTRPGGVELCLPETWAPLQPDGERFSNGQITLSVFAEVRLDHANALQRLSEIDSAHCTAEAYEFNVVRAGSALEEAWPALLQRYLEMPPACGACPNFVPPTELNAVANVSIAFAEYVLTTTASAPESVAMLNEIIDIGRTAHVQTDQMPPLSGDDISELFAQHTELCAP